MISQDIPKMELRNEKKFTECRCKTTNELLGYSTLHKEKDLQLMVNKARIAQLEWSQIPVKERTRRIIKIRDYIVANLDELAAIISRDTGKTLNDAMIAELFPATSALSYYCKNAPRFLRERKLPIGHLATINKRSKVIRVPWGIVAVIAPWNYPFIIPFSEVIMALLAGNAVILKMASQTQMVGLAMEKCLASADLPQDLFNLVNIPGQMAGDLLLKNGVNKLCFTGSVAVGQYLMGKAAETLTPLSLELGGNDAMMVCEDADIYRSVMGAVWAGFTNAGQTCAGVERIYVHEKIYKPFMELLKQKVETIQVEVGAEFNRDMGVITTPSQVKTVELYIDDALKKGAEIFAQSKIPVNPKLSNFFPATVLANVTHDMLVMKCEIFGPVIAVMKVNNITEAIKLVNDSDLGLTASVWSSNKYQAEKIARQLQVGIVTINDHLVSHAMPETPWGGFKKSGLGRTHGEIGFEEMTQPQVIIRDIMPFAKRNPWWPSNNLEVYNGIKGLIEISYSPLISKRLKGMKRLMKMLPRWFRQE
ncbi:MAG: aldehyde dehydrogenase family protein [Syntrophomonadaceae bacterium]|jgi:acyl-CoA reductase-like NAD-dependent aldehyde dehydrogenase